jgi:cysteine-rich repeat protein
MKFCFSEIARYLFIANLLLLTGCLAGEQKQCGDLICPAENVCLNQVRCAPIEAVNACIDTAAGERCVVPGTGGGACIDGVCELSICGDGLIQLPEICDDGNRISGDGCSDDCDSTEVCGNGIRDIGEECDGNKVSGDSCQPTCTLAVCGDGFVDLPREVCDDGNRIDGDGCSSTCLSTETCGNGVRDLSEECDDGNVVGGDVCQADCKLPRCGDGVTDSPRENCDDGNETDGDGCSARCRTEECGNQIRDIGEECDDGNVVSADECQDNCKLPVCGDGVVDASKGERCDDGNRVDLDGCNELCTSTEVCGNGFVDIAKGERCDDANFRQHDGCSSCREEQQVYRVPTPSAAPTIGGRANHLIAYDAARGTVVLMSLGQTWLWRDATGWVRRMTNVPITAAQNGSMVYDAKRQRVLLIASKIAAWNGERWSTLAADAVGAGPSAYDLHRDRVVKVTTSGTLEFDGEAWQAVSSTFPFGPRASGFPVDLPPLTGPAMAYDPIRRATLFFGGKSGRKEEANFPRSDRLWSWDGAQWTLLSSANGTQPSARIFASMAFDAVRGVMVMSGGGNVYQLSVPQMGYVLSGTAQQRNAWEWDGASWRDAGYTDSTAHHAMTFVAGTNQVMSMGGFVMPMSGLASNPLTLNRTAFWNGATFVDHVVAVPPSLPITARAFASVDYDPVRQTLVMVSSNVGSSGSAVFPIGSEVRTYEYSSSGWNEVAVPIIGAPLQDTDFPSVAFDHSRGVLIMIRAGILYERTVLGWVLRQAGTTASSAVYDPTTDALLVRTSEGLRRFDGQLQELVAPPSVDLVRFNPGTGRLISFGATSTEELVDGAWQPSQIPVRPEDSQVRYWPDRGTWIAFMKSFATTNGLISQMLQIVFSRLVLRLAITPPYTHSYCTGASLLSRVQTALRLARLPTIRLGINLRYRRMLSLHRSMKTAAAFKI